MVHPLRSMAKSTPRGISTEGTKRDPSFPHIYKLLSDGLGDVAQRHPELSDGLNTDVQAYLDISEKSGVEVAIDILRSYPPRTVTYILLGPMTNLALVMRQEGRLVAERIGRIVSMGGALDVPGNTSPVAECRKLSSGTVHH